MSDAIEAAAKALISAQRDMFRGGGWFALDDAKTLVSAALTAYEAAKGGGVGVKPLEWRNVDASPQSDDWWLEAVTPFGPYTVAFVEEHKLPWLLEPFRSNLDSNYATEDAAKAAAQADYEARIRSALTSPASGAEYRPTILHLRLALIAKMHAGEMTLEQVQAELKHIKRKAKANGQITRAQAYHR